MKLLNLTKHRRICLQEMLSELFYEFDIVKLKRNGFVVFKHNRFKFWDREKIHASELIIKEIPVRIERFARRFTMKNYFYYNPNIHENVIKIINEDNNVDIVEYLWSQFTKVKFKVNSMKPTLAITLGESTSNLSDVFQKHCESLIQTPINNLGDLLLHIKREFNNPRELKIKFNLKRIFNQDYFPIKQLIAA